jgi:chemotaxis protein CheX
MEISYDEALEQIAQSVLATMLEIESFRGDDSTAAEAGEIGSHVAIRGAYDGDVFLHFAPELARASAAAMFKLPPDQVTAEDMRDVATELANMIGGNLKSVLPGPSRLSLPTFIAVGTAATSAPVATVILTTTHGRLLANLCEGARF